MINSITKQQFYGEYINPTIEQYSLEKENPLVLMAKACHNIEKEYLSLPNYSFLSKQRQSISLKERKKSLKRISSIHLSSSTKKNSTTQSSFFDHHLNKTYSSSSPTIFDYSLLSSMNSSGFSPSFPYSSYLMDSILSSSLFVSNWFNSTISNDFSGKYLNNHLHFLEHSSMKSLYPHQYK